MELQEAPTILTSGAPNCRQRPTCMTTRLCDNHLAGGQAEPTKDSLLAGCSHLQEGHGRLPASRPGFRLLDDHDPTTTIDLRTPPLKNGETYELLPTPTDAPAPWIIHHTLPSS